MVMITGKDSYGKRLNSRKERANAVRSVTAGMCQVPRCHAGKSAADVAGGGKVYTAVEHDSGHLNNRLAA